MTLQSQFLTYFCGGIKGLATILVLWAIYSYFVASGYTIITAVSKLLAGASILLFLHGISPRKILGYTTEKVPELKFHLSKEMLHKVALLMASSWNYAVNGLKSLCCGNELLAYFKVVAIASGAGEARYNSRSQTQAASVNKKGKRPCDPSTSFRLIDEEDEEDEFEFEGGNHSTEADEFNVDHVEDED
ncbi:hypothetical protein POM88_014600 [Heracleum sosnowskyi]|uniref:Reticulon domain-containing protein n=1 Tax=Heracleum sosnowskyi TaxID=360622 RepID=A0AAD8IIJ2_9APIA|nr:hypothetical protein POM88_014600 [Heracleum sosnowskyi]